MVARLRDILKRAAPEWGLQPALWLATARRHWPQCAGQALAAVSLPLAVRQGRLEVAVTHPAAAQELKLRAVAIAGAVNRALGEQAVATVVPVMRRRLPDQGSPRAAAGHEDARTARARRQTLRRPGR